MHGRLIFPLAMGLIMGPMMLAALHGQLENGQAFSLALVGFVAAHVALALVAVLFVAIVARLSPDWRARLAKMHRPSLEHVATMLGSAAIAGLAVHLFNHGGL